MISVTIIGSGNVGFHLTRSFLNTKGVKLEQLFSRNKKDLEFWDNQVLTTHLYEELQPTDITIIAVSDDSIAEVSKHIKNDFVVHTSGGKSMNELQNLGRKGVFYPLQSFSRQKKVDFSTVPFCLEAEKSADLEILKKLSKAIGSESYQINSDQRKYLHVAAVFVNNFSNHMFSNAKEICDKNNIPFEVLLPLIKETAMKIEQMNPSEAQTGPAIRRDENTLKKHLNLLSGRQKELYKLITSSIQDNG